MVERQRLVHVLCYRPPLGLPRVPGRETGRRRGEAIRPVGEPPIDAA
jgi:hypothetical protein